MPNFSDNEGRSDFDFNLFKYQRGKENMAPKTKKVIRNKKPILIKVGNHLISPTDIRCISAVKKGKLYIIKFYSEPNPEWPCFVEPQDIGIILDYFNIVKSE